jgi:hypothetical protein
MNKRLIRSQPLTPLLHRQCRSDGCIMRQPFKDIVQVIALRARNWETHCTFTEPVVVVHSKLSRCWCRPSHCPPKLYLVQTHHGERRTDRNYLSITRSASTSHLLHDSAGGTVDLHLCSYHSRDRVDRVRIGEEGRGICFNLLDTKPFTGINPILALYARRERALDTPRTSLDNFWSRIGRLRVRKSQSRRSCLAFCCFVYVRSCHRR